jgi:hypothetical protein
MIGTDEANWESVSMYSILRKNFGLMIVPASENNTRKRSNKVREAGKWRTLGEPAGVNDILMNVSAG